MKKKVGHILSNFPVKSETFIVNHIVASIEKGFSAKILVDKLEDFNFSSQPELLKKYNLFKTAESFTPNLHENKFIRIFIAVILLLKNINYYKVFFKSLNKSKFNGKATSLKLWYQAAFFLKFNDIDVFHAHFGVNGIVLADLKEIGAIRKDIIISFYGYDTFATVENIEIIKLSYLNIFKQAKIILTNSKYLFNNLEQLNVPVNKVIVNFVGVDNCIFKYKERFPGKIFRIISVGRLIELKGHIYGLQLIQKLKEKGYNIQYSIIGEGVEFKNLLQVCKDFDIEDNVTFYGARNQLEIADLLHKNDLFLMTSIIDRNGRAEGQGLVTAEAQATGLPAVGFDCGGVPETIISNETGFIVKEKNIHELTEKVELLINNIDLRKQFGKCAEIFINESFNNKKQALKIIQLYEKCIT